MNENFQPLGENTDTGFMATVLKSDIIWHNSKMAA
jgi:hypothetical protein